jgi:hypothetical protein
MTPRLSTTHVRSRHALVALLACIATGASVQTASAEGTCVDACVSAFGVSFYNDRGDYFVLTDCATSLITGRTYCTYSRLPALQQ